MIFSREFKATAAFLGMVGIAELEYIGLTFAPVVTGTIMVLAISVFVWCGFYFSFKE